jgi:hypothetical protein
VSERLGHASIVVTGNTYLHVTEKIEDDALRLYEKYVKKGGKKINPSKPLIHKGYPILPSISNLIILGVHSPSRFTQNP